MQKVIFLDRDGVINIEKDYLYKVEDFEFVDGVFDALKYFQSLGYKLIVVTNQSGISRGYYTKDDFDKLTVWMVEQFRKNDIILDGVFCCPHGPNDNCNCRKPKTGMVDESLKLFDIDFENSWLIGDKDSDIQMAINSGIKNTIQVRSGHKFDEQTSKADYILDSIKDSISVIQQGY